MNFIGRAAYFTFFKTSYFVGAGSEFLLLTPARSDGHGSNIWVTHNKRAAFSFLLHISKFTRMYFHFVGDMTHTVRTLFIVSFLKVSTKVSTSTYKNIQFYLFRFVRINECNTSLRKLIVQ